jgi:hypothetical protein
MKLKHLVLLPLISAICLTACGSLDLLGTSPDFVDDGTALIRTDSAVYHVRTTSEAHELTIGVTFTNGTGGTTYIPTCRAPFPPVLQRWNGDQWVTVFSPVVAMCLGPPVVIPAGSTYHYSYRVMGSRRPNTYPRFETSEISGTYRLVWQILGSWTPDGPEPGLGVELPLEQRVSNSFVLVQ